jgi:hypothetical protein
MAMGKAMEDMTSSTYLKYKQKNWSTSHQNLFLFVTSVARTNFEVELVQRGGSLCVPPPSTIPLTPKRECIGKCCDRRMIRPRNNHIDIKIIQSNCPFSCTATCVGRSCEGTDDVACSPHVATFIRTALGSCSAISSYQPRGRSSLVAKRPDGSAHPVYTFASTSFRSKLV